MLNRVTITFKYFYKYILTNFLLYTYMFVQHNLFIDIFQSQIVDEGELTWNHVWNEFIF